MDEGLQQRGGGVGGVGQDLWEREARQSCLDEVTCGFVGGNLSRKLFSLAPAYIKIMQHGVL